MLFKFGNKKEQPVREKTIHHFAFIEAPIEVVGPLVMSWSEGAWWPQNSALKITRKTEGPLGAGVRFKQRLQKPLGLKWDPLAPRWEVEITKFLPNKLLERTFIRGPFRGRERITIELRSNGTRIDYELFYRVRGLHNMVFWSLTSEKAYSANMRHILIALKAYAVKMH